MFFEQRPANRRNFVQKVVAPLSVALALFISTGKAIASPSAGRGIPDKDFIRKFSQKTKQKLIVIDAEKFFRESRIKHSLLVSGNKKEIDKAKKAIRKEFLKSRIICDKDKIQDVLEKLTSGTGIVIWCFDSKTSIYVSGYLKQRENYYFETCSKYDFWPENKKRKYNLTKINIPREKLTYNVLNEIINYHEKAHLYQAKAARATLEYIGAKGYLLDEFVHLLMLVEKEADSYASLKFLTSGDKDAITGYASLRLLGSALGGPGFYEFEYKKIFEEGNENSLDFSRFGGAIYRTDEEIEAVQEFAEKVKLGDWRWVGDKLNEIFTHPNRTKNNQFMGREPYTPDIPKLIEKMQKGGLKALSDNDVYAISSAIVDSLDEEYKRMAMIAYLRSGMVNKKDPIAGANEIIRVYYIKAGMSERQKEYLEKMLEKAEKILTTKPQTQPQIRPEKKIHPEKKKDWQKQKQMAKPKQAIKAPKKIPPRLPQKQPLPRSRQAKQGKNLKHFAL